MRAEQVGSLHLLPVELAPLLRRLCALLVALLLAGCATDGCPANDATTAAAADHDIVFLHINDFHGQFRAQEPLWRERVPAARELPLVGGAAVLAGYIEGVRADAAATGARVVLTDAGDWYQGTLEGNESKGRLAIEFFARLALDVTVLGNHEYDFGDDNVKQLVAAAQFPVLGANVVVAGAQPRTLVPYVKPWHVIEVKGLKIVVLGLTAAETKQVSTGPFGEADFEDEEKALATVLPAARQAGDVVVLLTHCGLEIDRRLARAHPEIPLILGGHSHTSLEKPMIEGKTWILQTRGKASAVYRLEARVHSKDRQLELTHAELVELDVEHHPADAATERWLADQTKALSAVWDRVIGELVTPLLDDRGAHSTPAGNLLCDALIAATGADLAFSNKGGIRTRLRPGPLTPRKLYELMPFDNTVVCMTLRGDQVRRMLQNAAEKGRRLLDIGGGTYSYAIVDGARMLVDVTVAGRPLEDARTYRVAVSSFLAEGGQGLQVFREGTEREDRGVLVRDVLIAKAEKDKKLVADTAQRVFAVERDK